MVSGGRPPMHTGAILAKTCSLNWLLWADYSCLNCLKLINKWSQFDESLNHLESSWILHGLPCRWKTLISAANAMLYNFSLRLGFMMLYADWQYPLHKHFTTWHHAWHNMSICTLPVVEVHDISASKPHQSARQKAFQWLLSCAGDSEHQNMKSSKNQKSWYVFSVILQSWQNMCLGKKKKRGGENLRMPPVLSLCFKQATRKQAWRESNFWKPCCISDSVPVGTCNEMMAWGDCLNLTPDLYDLVISQTTFLLLQIFMNIHDIYIVSRSNISVFHDISCAFVVSKTVDGIWPEVRQGAWRPSLQASKLGNFRNSLDEHFETRAAKDFRREQQNVIHFKSRLKVSGFSFHLLSQCFSF